MSQEIELHITNAENGQQFNIELFINTNDSDRVRRRRFVAKPHENLYNSLSQWQDAFRYLVNPKNSRRYPETKLEELEELEQLEELEAIDEYEESQKTSLSCWESYQNLVTELNYWLNNDPSWRVIRGYLEQYLNELEEEIRVTIQTQNQVLRQLPWKAWDLFTQDYSKVETALSTPEYEPPKGWKGFIKKPQVKILVILGADEGIDIKSDETLLNKVRNRGAKIETLRQPQVQELRNKLTENSWHIVFFAGHSETNENGQGTLYLNNNRDCITIDGIEHELITAIENGLCLAIFNSCDGLGIADQLAEYRLPASIVMKEPVPNQLAIDFLEYFLNYFSRNESLFLSVHKARSFLKDKYDTKEQYPGSSWLPTLVPNLAVGLPTWKGFLSEYQFPPILRYLIISVSILGIIGFPLSIGIEFGWKTFLFYARLYPHMLLFPFMFFWVALWSVYKSYGQIIIKAKLTNQVLIALFASIAVLLIETSSSNMMLFEFNKSAQSAIDFKNIPAEVQTSIRAIPNELLNLQDSFNGDTLIIGKSNIENALKEFIVIKNSNKLTLEQTTGFNDLIELYLDYPNNWKKQKLWNWWSVSRIFYMLNFWIITFTVITFFILWKPSNDATKIFNPIKYINYLVFAQIVILSWIPFRLYYVLETKKTLFGYAGQDWLKELDSFVFLAITALSISTVINIFRTRQKYWLLFSTFLAIAIFLFIGYAQTDLIDKFFGLQSQSFNPLTWLLYPLFSLLCLLGFIRFQEN